MDAGAPTTTAAPSGTDSDFPVSEMPMSDFEDAFQQPKLAKYPPYSQFTVSAPSVADTIKAGHKIRVQHKSVIKKPAKPSPRPARPWGPKATDVKMSAGQTRRHLVCMRRHGAILTDRLERMAKPRRRTVIYLWREKADMLPADTIARLRAMLDADEPFKPDQAYEYFVNLRKTKKKAATMRGVNKVKKDLIAVCAGKKFMWARNATVAFARGIQQRLARPGKFALAEEMLRLSNIVLQELCEYMDVKIPSRRCTHPKAKFMMELSDKIAVWIDEVMNESEDRMLMMDFDEDADVLNAGDDDFADDFLNMMGGGGSRRGGPNSAYLQFGPETLEAFNILTDNMYQKNNETLYEHGKISQTYKGAADQLKSAENFEATHVNSTLAHDIRSKFTALTTSVTPKHLDHEMKNVIDMCANYLSSEGEKNKHKGKAYKLLTKTMRSKPNDVLYDNNKGKRTFKEAADVLDKAVSLEVGHHDRDLASNIHDKLTNIVDKITPDDTKAEMKDTINEISKYLSKAATDEADGRTKPMVGPDGKPMFGPNGEPILIGPDGRPYIIGPDGKPIYVGPDGKPLPGHAGQNTLLGPDGKPLLGPDGKPILIGPDGMPYYIGPNGQKILLGPDGKPLLGPDGKPILIGPDGKPYYIGPNGEKILLGPDGKPLLGPDGKPILIGPDGKPYCIGPNGEKILLGPDGKPLLGPDGKPILIGPDGKPYCIGPNGEKILLGPDGKPLLGPDGKPILIGPDGKPYYIGPNGEKILLGPDGKPLLGPDGKPNRIGTDVKPGNIGPNGENIPLGPDGKPLLGPDGKPILIGPDGKPYYIGPNGEKILLGPDGKPLLGPDGKPILIGPDGKPYCIGPNGEKILLGPDGKPLLGPDGKPILIGPDGKPYCIGPNGEKILLGPDGKPLLGPDGKPILIGPDGKPYCIGPNGEKILLGPDGKPLLGPDGKPILIGPDGKPYCIGPNGEKILLGPDGKPLLGPDGKSILGPDGKPILIGPDGKPYCIGPNGEKILLGPDGKPLLGPNGKPILIGPDGKPYCIGPNGEKILLGPDGKPLLGPDGKPILIGPDGKPYCIGPNGEKILLGPDGKPLLGPDGKPILIGPDGKPYCIGPNGEKILLGPDGKPLLGPDGKPILIGPDGKPYYIGPDGKKLLLGPDGKPVLGPNGQPIIVGPDGRLYYIGPNGEMVFCGSDGKPLLGLADGRPTDSKGGEGEGRKRSSRGSIGGAGDQELARAQKLLHHQLKAKGNEVFYQQPQTSLTHSEASDWLLKEETKVERSVRETADSIRLANKFERKLATLVENATPADMKDVMQDVVIEAGAKLATVFVAKTYKEVAKEGLIHEMQRQGNKLLVELDGGSETFFFAAQRLKKDPLPKATDPIFNVSQYLTRKLDEAIKCRTMPRKLYVSTKDYIRDAADYLSECVTKPDARIEAYVSLLNEMEAAGDTLLIDKDIKKSFKDAAAYLRQLTSFKDQINKSDSGLNSIIQSKLKNTMAHVEPKGYKSNDLNGIIGECTQLLVSYIVLQGERTKALKVVIEEMKGAGDNVLLRHGTIRKSYKDAVALLEGKNTDQMVVQQVDPIVARKIQTKLNTLMQGNKVLEASVLADIIQCATDYLAVNLLHAQIIKVCKCMKNVFVQCELWTDEILRRVTRPCCSCSRHVSTQALSELAARAPGFEVSLQPCPAAPHTHRSRRSVRCPAAQPQPSCPTHYASYLMLGAPSPMHCKPPPMPQRSPLPTTGTDFGTINVLYEQQSNGYGISNSDSSPVSYHTPDNTAIKDEYFWHDDKSVYSVRLEPQPFVKLKGEVHPEPRNSHIPRIDDIPLMPKFHYQSRNLPTTSSRSNDTPNQPSESRNDSLASKQRVSVVSTDQMLDWHAMMVSLMWNVQAWREWIQENVDTALNYDDTNVTIGRLNWAKYKKRVMVEAFQWRQYNIFSQQLTYRLDLRYRDKQIVSATCATTEVATIKTETYKDCQQEMIKIVEMFNKWTHWLLLVVQETDSIKLPENSNEIRWNHFKKKVSTYAKDWAKYNIHLKVSWEDKYKSIITEWLPSWRWLGPVWVVSACGAVPSGAVTAGVHNGEVIWVARTTHKNNVLPASLHPSKHCCLVYDQGSTHYYTKYQVLCNAEVVWVRWRAGAAGGVGARAVRVSPGAHVGRVLYRGSHLLGAVLDPHCRCHVTIFGKQFAFSCYELLVLVNDDQD